LTDALFESIVVSWALFVFKRSVFFWIVNPTGDYDVTIGVYTRDIYLVDVYPLNMNNLIWSFER